MERLWKIWLEVNEQKRNEVSKYKYAEILEALANRKPKPWCDDYPKSNHNHSITPDEYADYLKYHYTQCAAFNFAARILRMTPEKLRERFPDHFSGPDPDLLH